MASVRKREWSHKGEAKSAWVVSYTDQGGKRRLKTFEKKKDADRYRTKVESEIEGGTHTPDRDTVTLAEAAKAWLEDCERRHKIGSRMTGASLNGYRRYTSNHVLPAMGAFKLNAIEAQHIQKLLDDKSVSLARNSLKALRMCINQTLRFAVKRKWLRRNPLADEPIEIAGTARCKKVVPPTRDEIMRIMAVLSQRRANEPEHTRTMLMILIVLGAFAGLRRGEIAGLQWSDVDFDRKVLTIRHSLSRFDGLKAPKTQAGERTVPMSPPVLAMLDRYRDALGGEPTGFVLRNRDGRPVYVERVVTRGAWTRLMVDAGAVDAQGRPKYTLHALRHGNVSMLIEEGLDLFQIKHVVGHSRIATTADIYGHLMPESQRARMALDAVGERFSHSPLMDALPTPPRIAAPRRNFTSAREEALELRDSTPVSEIARRLRVSKGVVYKWFSEAAKAASATSAAPPSRQGRDMSVQVIDVT